MKKRKLAAKILSICMIFCLGFLCVGCAGNDSSYHQDLIDRYEKGEITYEELQDALQNSMSAPLYGTKVLYRPDNYDYGEGAAGNKAYYGQYAWWIMANLVFTYGISDPLRSAYLDENGVEQNYINKANNNYYYDSMRFQLDTQENIQYYKMIQQPDGKYVQDTSASSKYAQYSGKLNNAWNWRLDNQFSDTHTPDPDAYINDNWNSIGNAEIKNNKISNKYRITTLADGTTDNYQRYIKAYYEEPTYIDAYLTNYLGVPDLQSATGDNTESLFSNYVKAFEYVIYCYTMDLPPEKISVTFDAAAGTPIVNVGSFSSPDAALTYIKAVFEKIGTYVGVSTAKAKKISDFILKNIIGENALKSDTVTISDKTVTEYYSADGQTLIKSETVTNSQSTLTVGRDYANIIPSMVLHVCDKISIGKNSDGSDVTVDQRFPSSEIIDYYGNNFFISSDDEFKNILPLQYQSACLMFSEEIEVENLMLFFKYDAGLDGDDIVDPNASITINVHLNHYSKATNTWTEAATDTIVVPDGPFDYGANGNTLMMFGLGPTRTEGLKVGKFNTDIGDNILKLMNYNGLTAISNPKPLKGTDEARKYYQIVESPESDEHQPTYYSYAIFDPKMFGGSDGCDYLEIGYEVIKATGDTTTNYKFYTGIGLIA